MTMCLMSQLKGKLMPCQPQRNTHIKLIILILMASELLSRLYYDASDQGSLGGHRRLAARAREMGADVSAKQVKQWLRKQYTYTLHHPARRRFNRNPTIVNSINDQLQLDLVDLQMFKNENDGHAFLLCCINSFSKMAYVQPLKDKRAKTVAARIGKGARKRTSCLCV